MAKNIEMNIKDQQNYETLYPTAISNNTLLSSVINKLFNLSGNNQLDTALAQLFLGINNYGYVITVKDYNGNFVQNATISGSNISTPGGGDLKTDSNGEILLTSSNNSITINILSPIITLANQQVTIPSTQQLTYYTVTLQDNTNVSQVQLTAKYSTGSIANNIKINGVTDEYGNSLTTDSNGVINGYAQNTASISTTNEYYDLQQYSGSLNLTHGQVNQVNITIQTKSTTSATFSSSRNIKFSSAVSKFNCSAIGGGQNGSAGYYSSSSVTGGKGGNAGKIINQSNISNPKEQIQIIVGGIGGNSQVLNYIARGGQGAKGGNAVTIGTGDYRNGNDGEDSSGFLYPSTEVGGAGGSGEGYIQVGDNTGSVSRGEGGKPGGGGGTRTLDATSPGGGGCGGGAKYSTDSGGGTTYEVGKGKSGLVGIVWYYK